MPDTWTCEVEVTLSSFNWASCSDLVWQDSKKCTVFVIIFLFAEDVKQITAAGMWIESGMYEQFEIR